MAETCRICGSEAELNSHGVCENCREAKLPMWSDLMAWTGPIAEPKTDWYDNIDVDQHGIHEQHKRRPSWRPRTQRGGVR